MERLGTTSPLAAQFAAIKLPTYITHRAPPRPLHTRIWAMYQRTGVRLGPSVRRRVINGRLTEGHRAPNATYTLSYPLKYPEYSSSSSPTIWFDGQHATITSGSAFSGRAALFYRPYLASQSAQPIEIENVRLVPWPYAGSAIRIDRPNGEATGANCFLRNIQATGEQTLVSALQSLFGDATVGGSCCNGIWL